MSDTIRRHAVLLILSVTIVGVVLRWGTAPALLACVIALPVVAWRYDNRAGAFLPLALLFVIAAAVMVILIALLALVLRK